VLFAVAAALCLRAVLVFEFHDTWDFGIGTKAMANLLVGLGEESDETERVVHELGPDGGSGLREAVREQTPLGYVAAHPRPVLVHAGRNAGRLAIAMLHVTPPLPCWLGLDAFAGTMHQWVLPAMALVMLAVALVGLVASWRSSETKQAGAYLTSVVALYLLGLVLLNVHDRLVLPLVPLALVFLSYGLLSLLGTPLRAILLLAPMLALSIWGLLHDPDPAYATEPASLSEAGAWIAAHAAPERVLMSSSPVIGFYADRTGTVLDLPWATYPSLVESARRRRVALLAIATWDLADSHHPARAELAQPAAAHPGLELLASIGAEPSRVLVYGLEAGATEPLARR
jgi:hypothetical protein